MNNTSNNGQNNPAASNTEANASANPLSAKLDLTDSEHDQQRMQPEEVIFDLPDVKDIPGQEHIQVPPLGALADITISSDDEEGVGLFEDDEEDNNISIRTNDISSDEISMLETTGQDMPTPDDKMLREAALDNEDAEGEPLNEGSSATAISGTDLDVSGSEADDADEAIGEEDEENNNYSLGNDSNDNPA